MMRSYAIFEILRARLFLYKSTQKHEEGIIMTGPINNNKPAETPLPTCQEMQAQRAAAQEPKNNTLAGSVFTNGSTTGGCLEYERTVFDQNGTRVTAGGDFRASSDGITTNLGLGVRAGVEKDLCNGFSLYGGVRAGANLGITTQTVTRYSDTEISAVENEKTQQLQNMLNYAQSQGNSAEINEMTLQKVNDPNWSFEGEVPSSWCGNSAERSSDYLAAIIRDLPTAQEKEDFWAQYPEVMRDANPGHHMNSMSREEAIRQIEGNLDCEQYNAKSFSEGGVAYETTAQGYDNQINDMNRANNTPTTIMNTSVDITGAVGLTMMLMNICVSEADLKAGFT
jgi:hypothetical protein